MNSRELGHEAGRAIAQGRDTGAIAFVVLAQSELIDDVTITENADLFCEWDENWTGRVNTIVQDPADGRLYRKINSDFNTPFPQSRPSADPSQWRLIGDPGDEWPPWVQPLGAHDAYERGAQVTKNERRWVSDIDNNIWAPGVFGWSEHREEAVRV